MSTKLMLVRRRRAVEIFAEGVRIEEQPEYVRLTFCSQVRRVALVLTRTAFENLSRQIVAGPPARLLS